VRFSSANRDPRVYRGERGAASAQRRRGRVGVLIGAGLALALALPTRAHAQAVRTDFFITNGQVTVQAVRGNTLYVGGSFSYVGPVTGAGVPVDEVTGTVSPGFPRVNGTVMAAIPDGSGGWFIGGLFTDVGGSARANLAHVLSDQSVSSWNPGAGSTVRALLLRSGVLYVGGDFTTLGGLTRNRIGAVDASTGLTTTWNPNANSTVRAFADGGSGLIVGGQYTAIGGQARNRIARVNYGTGTADAGWNPNANSVVSALALDSGSGLLYVGGQFTNIDGQARNRLAALTASTGTSTSWNPNANSMVLSLAVGTGTVYAGGQFTTVGGQTRNRIAALSTSTGLATGWNPNASNIVQALLYSNGTVYAGGDFLIIGGQSRSRVAALDEVTGLASSWNPSAFSTVSALAWNAGLVFVGGTFNGIGGIPRNNLAAFDIVSGQATGWDPNANNQVQALQLTPDAVYVGGNFTQVGGAIRNNVAALDLTNGLATAWDPNVDGQVSALSVAGGRVFLGGLFGNVGGQPRGNLAAVDSVTAAVLPWIADTDNQVFVVDASTPKVYVGGSFFDVNGVLRNNAAALDPVTAAISPWNPDANGTVRAIVPTFDRVYLGGFFTNVGGAMRNRLAAVNLTTGAPLAWDPNANGPVFALTRAPATVYVGGVLSTVGGQTRNRVAAVDPITGALSPWDPNSNGTVRVITFDPTQVHIGGTFTTMNNVPSGNLAVTEPDAGAACPLISLAPPPLPPGVQGSPYSVSLAASGGTGPYFYTVHAGALPAGLALNPSTGQVSGTTTATGLSAFDIRATDVRGCTGTASYTVAVTAAAAVNQVAASTLGLCLNPAQLCASVPVVLTRGDSLGLRAVSVTFELETAKLQLCNPGPPSVNITLGGWASAFTNKTIQATALGGGRYTVDIVILGANCGETGGGTLFTVDLAAVGPTGTGAISVISVIARDCSNSPVAISAGPVAALPITNTAIVLSPATLPNSVTGAAYSEMVSASGGAGPFTFTVSAGSLPVGLTLSPAGLLSGTPMQAGSFAFTLKATEPGGCYGTRAYTVDITCPVIAIQPAYLPDGAAGEPYSANLLATAGAAPHVFAVTSGTLPDGLALSSSGALTGAPTSAGSTVFTVTATDAAGCIATRNYTLDVFASPPLSSLEVQTAGLAVSSAHPCVSVPFVYVRGESTPVRGLTVSLQIDPSMLALCSTPDSSVHVGTLFGSFPNAHTVVTDEGSGAYTVDITLLGAPCGVTAGGVLFTLDLKSVGPDGLGSVAVTRVRARDCSNVAVGVLAGAPANLRIQNTDITLAPPTLPNGGLGVPYAQAITAQSGLAPFTFTISAGALPPGFSLAPDGNLTGLPSATGNFAFTVSVADEGDVPGSRAYTMSVACAVIAITPSTLPDAQEGVAYNQTLTATGGVAPHTFAVVAGSLPAGLSLSAAGEISGTPSAAGVGVFTVRATDAGGCSGEEVYTLPVFVDPAISRVLPVTAGLCLSAVHPCVTVPFVYQKGDSVPAVGASVTFQLDSRFALCTPGNPALSILPGSWLAGYANDVFHVIDHGGGSYTVDQALLGLPCGPDTGGVLFTVNVAVAGADGVGDITVTEAHIRDCANAPLPGQPGPAAQLVISHAPPPSIADLTAAQVVTGNGPGPLVRLRLEWTAPADGQVAIYRAPFGSYPEYDDTGGTTPSAAAAPGAPWVLVNANATSPLLHVPPVRGVWHFVAIVTDSCGNASLASNLTPGIVNYHLGDVSNGLVRGAGDGRVATEDVSLLGAHYGISGGTLVADTVTYLDIGPTVNGQPWGRPATDDLIDFEDLMLFSTNFGNVSAPQDAAPSAPTPKAGKGEAFELEFPPLVSAGDEFEATLGLSASGALQGFSASLAWDAGVAQPVSVTSAGFLESQGGIALSPGRGRIDGALLGVRGSGIQGQGAVARFRFVALRDGEPGLRVASVLARDAANHTVDPEAVSRSVAASLPARTLMLSPAPNPAVGEAHLTFALARADEAELCLYSVDGRRVRTLARGRLEAGAHRLTWRGEDDAGRSVAPGVYWARLKTSGLTFTRRVVFLR